MRHASANIHLIYVAVTDLFIRMLDTILSNPEKVSHGREGYFFGANEEFSGREGVQAVSDALFALGRIPSPEVVKYSLDGIAKYYASILPPSFGSHGGQVRLPTSVLPTYG